MKWFLCFLSLTLVAAPQRNAFKPFAEQGESFISEGNYAEALKAFQEAFRLEKTAKRYKLEGSFFASYLPRYKIALCYEHLNIVKAETWVNKSKEAQEDKILKKKDEKATYHADLQRILDKVKKHRSDLAVAYNAKLSEANDLLNRHRFSDAKKAFEDLMKMDPSRNDGSVGLARITPARETYLKNLLLNAKMALVEEKFDAAEAIAKQMATVDQGYPSLITLRADIKKAREKANAAAAAPKEVKTTPVVMAKPKEEPKKQPIVRNDPKPKPRDNAAAEKARIAKNKQRLRDELIETLKPYRRGDPEAALAKLNEIDVNFAQKYASYHWLKGVYQLSYWHFTEQKDNDLRENAKTAIQEALKLSPNFVPDESLYPSFILSAFQEVKTN